MKAIFLSLLFALPALASCPKETKVPVGGTITLLKNEKGPAYHWHAMDKKTAILLLEREWTSPADHEHAAMGTAAYYFAEYRALAKGSSDVWLEYRGPVGVVQQTCVTVEVY